MRAKRPGSRRGKLLVGVIFLLALIFALALRWSIQHVQKISPPPPPPSSNGAGSK